MIWEALGAWHLGVSREMCMGHARCVDLAPDLFDLDDDGISVPQRAVVKGGDVRAAKAAALACPERAVQLTAEAEQ
jgi:ferredoxin